MSSAEDPTQSLSTLSNGPIKGTIVGADLELVEKLNWPWLAEPWRAIDRSNTIQDPILALVPEGFYQQAARLAELKEVVARNAAAQHPNLLPTRRWIDEGGRAAIAMSCGRTSSLTHLLAARPGGFYEVAHLKFWLAQLCRVLADAHAVGMLHGWLATRDLLISGSGDLLAANFGVTRLLANDGAADEGILAALSPQALGGKPLSVSDDIYSLGALIYELLTGAPIFAGPAISQKILNEKVPSISERRQALNRSGGAIPQYFEEVVAACLAKDPVGRPSSVQDVARHLGIELPAQPMAGLTTFANASGSAPTTGTPSGAGIVPANLLVSEASLKKGGLATIPPGEKSIVPYQAGLRKPNPAIWIAGAVVILGITAYFATTSHQDNEKLAMIAATPSATPVPTLPPPTPVPSTSLNTIKATPAPTLAVAVASPKATPAASATASPTPSQSLAVLPDNLPNFGQPSPGASPASASPLPSPSAATLWTNSLGMKFAPVGSMKFCIWETRVEDFKFFARAENIRNTQWEQPGFHQGPDHPVVYVSWDDAMAFCKWLTDKEHQSGVLAKDKIYRLPTDLEWSKAVGLPNETGATPEARDMGVPDVYPWGTQWPPPAGAGNYTGDETGSDVAIHGYDDGYVWTAPVGSFKPNAFGLYDLGGNVWEWCIDYWNNAHRARVLRGGSWYNGSLKLSLLSSCRVNASQDSSTDNYGFRIVIAPAKSTSASGKP